MLAGIAIARPAPCAASIAAATLSHASRLRDETTTRAPASAMRSAMARPMPRVDPVMTATRSVSEKSDMAIPPRVNGSCDEKGERRRDLDRESPRCEAA
jgi:hypothetical protein